MNTTTAGFEETPTGLEDVIRSVRALARTTRSLTEEAGHVAERELAMAITISEQLRDNVLNKEGLERARAEKLPAKLRQDAHRMVDLFADVAAVAFATTVRFVENFTDERRPPVGRKTSSA
ncbi:MAG: hypothetical protein Q7J84_17225 [Sulfuricaulis sp.]|nr:hypothetical protein [Sulfuricaulis sp.]